MSKSVEKRVKVQKSAKTAAKGPKTDLIGELAAEIVKLTEKVEKLEKKGQILEKSLLFVANELRPIYGLGAIALVFDEVVTRLKK
ncbi:hypothetical protein LCGC14_1366910 [marine sediment metagenome]|uniref:Uncharacterized protein n=1 Tax=marine sediment metagenome TaxID=412755 RepID=A0A0F9MLK7_9ZZZZ